MTKVEQRGADIYEKRTWFGDSPRVLKDGFTVDNAGKFIVTPTQEEVDDYHMQWNMLWYIRKITKFIGIPAFIILMAHSCNESNKQFKIDSTQDFNKIKNLCTYLISKPNFEKDVQDKFVKVIEDAKRSNRKSFAIYDLSDDLTLRINADYLHNSGKNGNGIPQIKVSFSFKDTKYSQDRCYFLVDPMTNQQISPLRFE